MISSIYTVFNLRISHKGKSNFVLNRSKRVEKVNKETQEKKMLAEKEEIIGKLQSEVNLLRTELDLAFDH